MEWKITNIGSLCDRVCSGGTPKSTNNAYYNGNIPWLNTKEVNFNRIYDTEKNITQLGLENSSAKWISENSVIVAMYGATAGKVAITKIPITTNQACCNLSINSEIADYNFVYYFLCSKFYELSSLANGGAQQNLNAQIIKDFPIKIPVNLSDQKKIAGILSALDAKIENNNKINANLEAQAQALFKSWFVDFTPFKDQPFVDSELGPIPQGWKVGKLTDIAVYLNGLAMQKFPPQDIKDSFPVLKIKELGAGICDNSSDRCSNKVPKKYIIEDGDIIFSWSGTLMVDVWCGGQCGLNQHLFKVSSSNYPKWFYYHWTKKHLRDFIHIARDKAVTMGHIKRGHLDNALVVVPNNFILEKATHLFEPLLNMVISKRIENQRLAALRDTLLPKLMSGEIKL